MLFKNATFISLVMVGVLLFSMYAFRFLIQGPQIDIAAYPATVQQNYIDISLQSSNTQEIVISGNQVTPLLDGSVRYRQYLQPGNNVIVLQARDRYGSLIERQVEVLYQNAVSS